MPNKELDSIKKEFVKYLDSLGLSPKTHKNYRSDLAHFIGWAILRVRSFGSYVDSLTEAIPFLTQDFAKEYKNYMTENKAPVKTVNRRLSTLRHLSKFLLASQVVDFDFMQGIENAGSFASSTHKKQSIDPVMNDFKAFLEAEKVSANTIKNYLSDIKQFMSWVEANQPKAQTTN